MELIGASECRFEHTGGIAQNVGSPSTAPRLETSPTDCWGERFGRSPMIPAGQFGGLTKTEVEETP